MTTTIRTLGQVLDATTTYLTSRGVDLPQLAAELLLERLLKLPRLELSLHLEREMTETHLEAMRRGMKRIGDGEPVQYVLGEVSFRGHALTVDSRCLIPRPETEVLVETVLNCAPLWEGSPGIIDVGTGSGCIVIALALERAQGRYVGYDVSNDALEIAQANATRCGVDEKIAFVGGDLSEILEPESLDAIISNPPYIPSAECDRLPVHIREHEPRLALDGGPDGLDIVRGLIEDAPILLKAEGWLFFELGDGQAERVADMMRETGFADVARIKDLTGRERIVSGRLAI